MKRLTIVIASALLLAVLLITGLVPQPVKNVFAQACQGAGICSIAGRAYFQNGVLGNVYDPNTPTLVVVALTPVAPLGFHQPISSTGATTLTLSIQPANWCSVITNVGAQNIVVVDSGINKLSGNQTLGTTDSIGMCSNGTNWYEFTESDN